MEEEKKELEEVETEENKKFHFPWTILIIAGILVALIVVCIVVMCVCGGPVNGAKN